MSRGSKIEIFRVGESNADTYTMADSTKYETSPTPRQRMVRGDPPPMTRSTLNVRPTSLAQKLASIGYQPHISDEAFAAFRAELAKP